MRAAIAALALVVSSCTLAFSCTHAQVVAGENAAEACGISDGKSLLGSIASDLAAGGLAAAEAAIGSDKALAGLAGDAINCLVSVVVAVESACAGSGSAIATSEAAPSRSALIVANGNAYLAKHGGK